MDTSAAAEELHTASDYQRKAGRRAACLMIVLVFVVCIVLLAVSLTHAVRRVSADCGLHQILS